MRCSARSISPGGADLDEMEYPVGRIPAAVLYGALGGVRQVDLPGDDLNRRKPAAVVRLKLLLILISIDAFALFGNRFRVRGHVPHRAAFWPVRMDNSFVLLMRNLENMLACPRSRCQAETPSPASFLILTPRKVDPYSPIRSRRGRDASEMRMLGAAVLPGGGVYSREPGALELIAC